MDSEYQPISRVERLTAAHPWLLESQAWKLLSIKYVLIGPELTHPQSRSPRTDHAGVGRSSGGDG